MYIPSLEQGMDIFVLKAVVDELQQQLPGALVSKVYQMSRHDVLLRLWRGRDLRLVLSIHPTMQRLHLTTQRFDNPPRPPRFAAFLRAHLQGLRLRSIAVEPYDRIVSLTWGQPGGDEATLTLIHELTGPHANLVLTDAAGIIVEALKHVPADDKHARAMTPGLPYSAPPRPPRRFPVSSVTLELLQQLHQQGQLDGPHLQRLLVGVSPGLLAALVARSQGEPRLCWEHLQALMAQYNTQTLSLGMVTLPDGQRLLSAFPDAPPGTTVETFARAQEAVAAYYEPAMMQTLCESLRHEMDTTLRQRLMKLRKKADNLRQDYAKLQSYLPYQHYGTLLVAQRLPRGMPQATVVDYSHPEQPTVTIPLDPKLSGQENAQGYFKRYRKAKQGMAKVQALIQQCATDVQRLERLVAQTAQAADWQALCTLAEELPQESRMAEVTAQSPSSRPRPASARPYRTLVSSDGYTLYCGKSDEGNEALLRHVAAPHDLWLHAHQQAGSHVLIKVLPKQEVPRRTLLEAAALAAYYSKGKHAAMVEVIYTQARYVQKFRGAHPGQVQVREYRKITVAPRLLGRSSP